MKKIHGNFTMIPNNFINDARLDVYEFRVLCYLFKLSDDKFCCYPSYETIARETGISTSKAIRSIKKLISLGIITKECRETKHNEYITNFYTICIGKIRDQYGKSAYSNDSRISDSQDGISDTQDGISDMQYGISDMQDGISDTQDGSYDAQDSICDTQGHLPCTDGGVYTAQGGVCGTHNQYTYTNIHNNNSQYIKTYPSDLEQLMDRAETYNLEGQLRRDFETALEIMYTSSHITVGGDDIPRAVVRQRLENISYEHVVSVDRNKPRKLVDGKLTDDVRNPVAYIITALFNSLRYTEKEIMEIEYGDLWDYD